MRWKAFLERSVPTRRSVTVLAAVLLCSGTAHAQANQADQSGAADQSASRGKKDQQKSNEPAKVKLKIQVTSPDDKPIGNASVYVRFNESGGLFHHDKLAELNLKTNQDGSVKVPEIPQGNILIQVVAKGWRTYGKWYDIETDEQSIPIKLDPPPHWY
jgi:hypothetical protein